MKAAKLFVYLFAGCFLSCAQDENRIDDNVAAKDTTSIDCMPVVARFTSADSIPNTGDPAGNREGMVKLPGGTFMMGGNNEQASPDEFPRHEVTVAPFWIDVAEVTNAQFQKFVDATGYITTAERKPDWAELSKTLPPGTAKPADELLVPASLVVKIPTHEVDLHDYGQWWKWTPGADWKHPQGPGSNLEGKNNFPVVHVSWDDAMAYCKWAGKRLPTEAEWEFASRSGMKEAIYPWGDEPIHSGEAKANSWDGTFPSNNTKKDGHVFVAPVKSYAPNKYGLYDMAGNVWEWCSDWYDANYYESVKDGVKNPKGPQKSFDPQEPYMPKRVVRGGSFLCNDSYCSGYRSSRRMRTSPDTGLEHTGFRCVADE